MTAETELQAGPELDIVVAKAIGCIGVGTPAGTWWYLGKQTWNECPKFSTTWEGLGLVVERMRERGFDFTLSHAGRDGWFASFKQSMPGMSSARNRSAPHAVCLAALRALASTAPSSPNLA